jgi:aldehyde:ferredoxin oxidoreductase
MYAFGYGNLAAATDLISSLNLPSPLCASCHSCQVRCARNFEVKERLNELASVIPSLTVA